MTIELNKTNTNIVSKMIAAGKSYSAIKNAMLALDMVEKPEHAEEYLEAQQGIKKGAKRGLTDRMYDFLQEKPRTQVELYSWIKENGTENTWRWRKTHDKVRELTVRLHVELSGVTFTEKAYAEPETKGEAKDAA